jgi:hypothetical protein
MPVDDFLVWLVASDSALLDATLLPELSAGGFSA